jgi:hypothetical protein
VRSEFSFSVLEAYNATTTRHKKGKEPTNIYVRGGTSEDPVLLMSPEKQASQCLRFTHVGLDRATLSLGEKR